jgi:hypothetical protein
MQKFVKNIDWNIAFSIFENSAFLREEKPLSFAIFDK